MEPSPVLVSAFEVKVGREGQLRFMAEHGSET